MLFVYRQTQVRQINDWGECLNATAMAGAMQGKKFIFQRTDNDGHYGKK